LEVFLERMVKVVGMENKEFKVHLDPRVKEDCLVCLVYLDPKDIEVFLASMGQRVA
jgi:hypothetical protein